MKHNFTKLVLALILIFTFQSSRASHIMGGNLRYTYVGLQGNGNYRYIVTLNLYRFCGTSVPTPSPLPANMKLGVYNQDPANPNADKVLQLSTSAPLISQQFIQPPNANDSCAFTPNACVEEGIYEITIDLPPTANGYHVIMDRCCRNGNIQNVFDPSNEGEAWYAFIPATSVVNSSPVFAVPPVPFICAGDSVSTLNSASDPDGDLLIYHFVTPFGGISDPGNSNPNFPPTYTWPIPTIGYAAGYSFAQPFGPGGSAIIDSTTGLTTYFAPTQGYYVVAVEITEYRNGVLVGITRLDFQLILISCPVNPAPVASAGSTSTTFSVQEGQNLCFNIAFNDPNGDSLSMTHTGAIFGAPTNPVATLANVIGDSVVTSQFCWPTSCLQGQSNPYQFTVTCADNGCPAKTISQVYTIFVIPFVGVNSINGPDTLCSNQITGLSFSAAGTVGSTYNWTVTNGTQVSGGSTGTIIVNFNLTGPYSVSVTEVNAIGCAGNTVTKNIIVKAQPTVNAGIDKSFCSGGSAALGGVSTSGYLYTWTPSTGLTTSSTSNPTVTLTNGGATPTTNTYIVTTNLNGCTNKDTVIVTVNPLPVSNAGNNQFLCSGNTVTIGTLNTTGYIYSWTPSSGLSSSSISNPTVTWTNSSGQPDTLNYTVTTTNSFACTSTDNIQIIVNVLPNVVANPSPLSVCPGSPATLTATGANLYSWALLTNPGTAIGSTNPLVVSPLVTTSYIVTGTSSLNCVNKDTITVTVLPKPSVVATQNTDSICPSDTVILNASGGISYSWATQPSPTTVLGTGTSLTVNPGITTNYVVTGTGSNGCTNKDTITVHVNPAPVANAGNNQSLCSAATVLLGTLSTSGYTYSWSPSTGLSSSTISNPTLTLTNVTNTPDTTIYTVVTTNQFGCTASDNATIIANPIPNAIAGIDKIFCSGQNSVLGGSSVAGYSYLWNPSSGLLGPTTSNPTVTLTNLTTVNDTVQYIVTTTWFGCIDKDTVLVIVKPLPVSNAGNDQTICSGDTIQLGAASTSGYTYVWTPATGLSGTAISNPTAIITGTTISTTTYNVITTLNGCVTQDSVTITLNPLPLVNATALPTAICIGTSATLTGTGAASYSWALLTNPGSAIGTTNPITVNPVISTSYIVTGTSSTSCVNSDTITVTVNPLPSVIASAPNDSICLGDSITLSGVGASSYSWAVLGGSVISSNSSVTINPTVTTSYVVTGTDAIGCQNKDTITITVNPAPTLSGITGTLSVCPGVTGVPYWVNNPNPNSTYNWVVTGGVVANGQGQDTVFVDWGAAGTGTVTATEVTDVGCSSQPIILTVTINALLTPQAPSGLPVICANDAQGLTYTVINTPGSVYTWFILGGTIVSGNSTSSVVVDWTLTGPATGYLWYEENVTADTVCFGVSDTFQVTINPKPITSAIQGPTQLCVFDSTNFNVTSTLGSAYQWAVTGGTIASGQGSNQVNINWGTSGNYTVSVVETNTFGCVGDTIPFNIIINPLPAANAGADIALCNGQSANLTASGGTNYSWSPSAGLSNTTIPDPVANPTATTTYVVLVTDANGCSKTDDIIVTVNSLPVVTTSASPNAICVGSSSNLQASGGTSYSWTPSTGLSNTAIATPSANPTVTTTYTVTVTDNNLCSSTSSITVTVNDLPVVVASVDVLICDSTETTLSASGAITYLWSPSTGLNSTSLASPIAAPHTTTTYIVTGTDVNGCINTDNVTVSVNPKPYAAFTDSAIASCGGIEVTFTDASISADSYSWNFGDGTALSTDINPEHHYDFAASVTVTLIVGNGGICFDTVSTDLKLLSLNDYLKSTPNVFTPNGDGKNDCFSLNGLGDFKACTTIKIFDRWGKQVFSSSDSEVCWDGKANNGNDVPAGTYFYVIEISGKNLNGTVMLLR